MLYIADQRKFFIEPISSTKPIKFCIHVACRRFERQFIGLGSNGSSEPFHAFLPSQFHICSSSSSPSPSRLYNYLAKLTCFFLVYLLTWNLSTLKESKPLNPLIFGHNSFSLINIFTSKYQNILYNWNNLA